MIDSILFRSMKIELSLKSTESVSCQCNVLQSTIRESIDNGSPRPNGKSRECGVSASNQYPRTYT